MASVTERLHGSLHSISTTLNDNSHALASVTRFGGSIGWRGHRFNSHSEHIPRLGVRSLVGVHTGGNLSMLLSCIDISFSACLPFPLSKISKHVLG